jgi:argininosuccinate lyase
MSSTRIYTGPYAATEIIDETAHVLDLEAAGLIDRDEATARLNELDSLSRDYKD